jgi:hypothetical protein
MKKITLLLFFLIASLSMASAQNWIKLAGKLHEGPAEVAPGIMLQAGDQIELHEGLAPEGFRHIYGGIGMTPVPLGYGANYETLTIAEIRYNKKQDMYFATVEYSKVTYLVEVDKGLKSGEIKRVIKAGGSYE